jgi:cystathionine gamma-synthase
MKDGLSRETLAAQALGGIDQASGALSPAIHPSTIYERSPDGSYRSGLAYTRADNPTYDHAERLLAALEGGVACMLFASDSAAATAVFQSLLPGITSLSRGFSTGAFASGWRSSQSRGGSTSSSSTPRTLPK